MRSPIEYRFAISLALGAGIGTLALRRWPFPADNLWLDAIHRVRPAVFENLAYIYAALWFTTPSFAISVTLSLAFIFASRRRYAGQALLPQYADPGSRDELYLVLGEQHHRLTADRASTPRWLTIPERGLYTGIAIVGAVGTGKTSACIYPYVEQLLAYRAGDATRKVAALVLEVKGDFCSHVREILARHGRSDDYVEVSLESRYRYNPLHSDLDAYALAYGIATLMTNLFGRGKEKFWQQASTNLVKFVILLHQIIVGEVRGAEAFDLLQALNTGHSGSMSTLHANSATHAPRGWLHA
jgi:hypothetical protein